MPHKTHLLLSLSITTLLFSACAGIETEHDANDIIINAISGKSSDTKTDDDAVVLLGLVTDDDADGPFESFCTGTLIAPNAVLTSRFCLSNIKGGYHCSTQFHVEQKPASDGPISTRRAPITVFAANGARRPVQLVGKTAAELDSLILAKSKKIDVSADSERELCGNDIGVLILDKPVVTIVPVKVGYESTIVEKQKLEWVSWGDSVDPLPDGGTDRRWKPVVIDAIGPGNASRSWLGALNELKKLTWRYPNLGASTSFIKERVCRGDEGSPIFDEDNNVVGIVSGQGETRAGEQCKESSWYGVLTHVASFKSLIETAIAHADHPPASPSPVPASGTKRPPLPTTVVDGGPGPSAASPGASDASVVDPTASVAPPAVLDAGKVPTAKTPGMAVASAPELEPVEEDNDQPPAFNASDESSCAMGRHTSPFGPSSIFMLAATSLLFIRRRRPTA